MDVDVERFHDALQALRRAVEAELLQEIQDQITGPQMFMLYYIDQLGPCKLTELAEKLEVKPSAVTVMIDRLEKAGFVERTHDTVDRRAVRVEATPIGREVLEKAVAKRNEIIGAYLSRLGPGEAWQVTALLEKMVQPKREPAADGE